MKSIKHILGLLGCVTLLTMSCKNDPPPNLNDRLKEDHRESRFVWGYINDSGQWSIEPQFDDCRDFHNGLAAAMDDGLWGYINKDGNWSIQPQFAEAHDFVFGVAKIRSSNGLYGVIDQTGSSILEPKYARLDVSHPEWFLVGDGMEYKIINRHEESITTELLESASRFVNGQSVVKQKGAYHLLSSEGELVGKAETIIPAPNFPYPAKDRQGWSWIDAEGHWYTDQRFDMVSTWEDGIAVALKDDLSHVLNEQLKVLWTDTLEIEHLGHGVFIQYLEDEKGQLLNMQGESLDLGLISEAHPFSGRHAAIRQDSIWTFVNTSGQMIREPFSPLVWQFEHGLCRAIINGGIGFIDSTGQMVIPADFYEVKDFSEGLARAQGMR